MIDHVACLRCDGVDPPFSIIAVAIHRRVAGRPHAGGDAVITSTEQVAVVVAKEDGEKPFVDPPITVIVDAFASFRATRVDSGLLIVAVVPANGAPGAVACTTGCRDEAVAVCVPFRTCDSAVVAVLVFQVANLRVPWEAVRVRVVAIDASSFDGVVAIAVRVASGAAVRDAGTGRFLASLSVSARATVAHHTSPRVCHRIGGAT